MLLNYEQPFKCNNIVINTDSLITINAVTGHNNLSKFKSVKIIRKLVAELKRVTGAKIEFRHVKAHIKKDERQGKHIMNEWCDKEAKRWTKFLLKKDLVVSE